MSKLRCVTLQKTLGTPKNPVTVLKYNQPLSKILTLEPLKGTLSGLKRVDHDILQHAVCKYTGMGELRMAIATVPSPKIYTNQRGYDLFNKVIPQNVVVHPQAVPQDDSPVNLYIINSLDGDVDNSGQFAFKSLLYCVLVTGIWNLRPGVHKPPKPPKDSRLTPDKALIHAPRISKKKKIKPLLTPDEALIHKPRVSKKKKVKPSLTPDEALIHAPRKSKPRKVTPSLKPDDALIHDPKVSKKKKVTPDKTPDKAIRWPKRVEDIPVKVVKRKPE